MALLAALVTWAVARGWTAAADFALLRAVAGAAGGEPAWRSVAWGVTRLGDPAVRYVVMASVAAALVAWRRDRAGAGVLIGIGLLATAVNSGLKLWVARPRPELLPRLDHVTTLSFPSGHAANSTAAYLLAGLLLARAGAGRWTVAAALALVAAIGSTRVALAVHWPSDVFAGWCLGAAWALLGLVAADRLDPMRRLRG